MLRARAIGSGEAALRISQRIARRRGLKDLEGKLKQLLRNDEDATLAGVALEDETRGSLLRDILAAIWADPEKFKDLVEWLIELFSGLMAEPAPTE